MSDSIKRVEYYYIEIDDKPGMWSWFLQYLRDSKVNMVAFTAFPTGDGKMQLDFFPENPDRLKDAASAAAVELVGPKKAFLIQGDDRTGALLECQLKLTEANINVYAANGSSGGEGRFGYVMWVKPDDYENAARALGV